MPKVDESANHGSIPIVAVPLLSAAPGLFFRRRPEGVIYDECISRAPQGTLYTETAATLLAMHVVRNLSTATRLKEIRRWGFRRRCFVVRVTI
jgi:hypothetical protein